MDTLGDPKPRQGALAPFEGPGKEETYASSDGETWVRVKGAWTRLCPA